jgi:hypothetical protein
MLLISMRHIQAATDVGTLLLITIQWWQLVAGVSFPLLEHPAEPLPYLSVDWFSVFRTFLAEIQGSLHIPAVTNDLISPPRTQDSNLMDTVSSLPSVATADLQRFNRVRLWMGVTYLSEILSADGCHLARDAWTGTRPCFTPRLWPFQEKPDNLGLRVWRRFLTDAFLKGHRH